MDQIFKWKKLDMIENGKNYSINLFTGEIRKDTTGKILKQCLSKGYYRVNLSLHGKRKHYCVHVLVWIAYNGPYDTSKFVIDHMDRNKTNNNINNLRLVTPHINNINISNYKGVKFDYKSELPDAIIINSEHRIYYCKLYDKFYREVVKGQYRELKECKRNSSNRTRIQWWSNNKQYEFTTTNFRNNL